MGAPTPTSGKGSATPSGKGSSASPSAKGDGKGKGGKGKGKGKGKGGTIIVSETNLYRVRKTKKNWCLLCCHVMLIVMGVMMAIIPYWRMEQMPSFMMYGHLHNVGLVSMTRGDGEIIGIDDLSHYQCIVAGIILRDTWSAVCKGLYCRFFENKCHWFFWQFKIGFCLAGLLLIACFLCAIICSTVFLNTSKLLKKAVLMSYFINIVFFLVTIIYPIYSWAFVNRINVYGYYPLQPLGPIAFMSWFVCMISIICLFILIKLFRNVYKLERGLMPGDVIAPPSPRGERDARVNPPRPSPPPSY